MVSEKLGVCILNWNAGLTLLDCVNSLRTATRDDDCELVVVDNHSTDASVELLRSALPSVTILRNVRNLGYAKGNNIGAKVLLERDCKLLMFINPDVLITNAALSALREAVTENSRVGCVGGLPTNDGGVSRMACRNRPSFVDTLILYGPLARLPWIGRVRRRHFIDWQSLPDNAPVYAVSGACILFPVAAFTAIGGFDENTFLYQEEFIVSEKLRSLGWTIVLSKKAPYQHAEGHSTNQVPYRRRLDFIRSEQYVARTYYRWNAGLRMFLRGVRYAEWIPYVIKHWAQRRLARA